MNTIMAEWNNNLEHTEIVDYNDFDIEGMESPLTDEEFSKYESYIHELTYATGRETGFDLLIDEFLSQYYGTGTLSARDCAEQIQERAIIYYNE